MGWSEFPPSRRDPLAAGNLPSWCRAKAIDAVDVVAILDHGGDLKATLRTLAQQFGIDTPRPAATPEPPPHPGYDGLEDWGARVRTSLAPPGTAEQPNDENSRAALRTLLSIESWAERDIPEPDRLLGDLLTPTTRVFLVGRAASGEDPAGYRHRGGCGERARFPALAVCPAGAGALPGRRNAWRS